MDHNAAMEGCAMNPSRLIAEVEILEENVLIVFQPERAALLKAEDLHELATSKNAFITLKNEDDAQDF
jgi:hypothetical protein